MTTSHAIERIVPDALERDAANRRMVALLSQPDPGPVAEHLALLHFTGRRSGREFVLPAGVHPWRERLVVATGSAWRHNFDGGSRGALTWRGEHTAVHFRLISDVDQVAPAYQELIERYGVQTSERRLGLRLPADRVPSLEEIVEAVERCGLGLVEVTGNFLVSTGHRRDLSTGRTVQ
ncbi:hypothetical protein FKR81_19670 [Lentzea tibetensis]|uniref:Uncharacterized protein n=1 Tax=Lentzea tibetensis TaxID=2591470 RepID=A0A563ESA0_9PSEU|nr:hypothetical protein [Lentzea tibetensis]TWP50401.1 hypothetical protein FKR81_19670 [Lentzea tibetensis]